MTLVCRKSVETISNGFPQGTHSACGGFAQQALYRAGYEVPLFAIGYEKAGIEDETSHAQEIAKHIGADLKIVSLDREETTEAIEKSIISLDEPLYSSVCPSTWALSRYASQYVKGVLSGDGSDELLLGYRYIRDAMRAKNLTEVITNYHRSIAWLDKSTMERLIPWTRPYGELDVISIRQGEGAAEAMRRFEIGSRLPDYHLARVDCMSMAHGTRGSRSLFARQRCFRRVLLTTRKNF